MKKSLFLSTLISFSIMGIISVNANNTTIGTNLIVNGDNNTVASSNSVILGYNISSLGGENVAIGLGAQAGSQDAPNPPDQTTGATAIGAGSKATGYSATALGQSANASNHFSIAIGDNSKANGEYSIALGQKANASDPSSTAIGTNSTASSIYSTALGVKSEATGVASTALGIKANASGISSIAIGPSAISNTFATIAIGGNAKATAEEAVSIGKDANAAGRLSLALGYKASATDDNSVALGNNSSTSTPISTSEITVGGQTYNTAGNTAYGTVSVGNQNMQRTITNVAAGRVAADSTDAINGSELYAVVTTVNTNTANIATNTADIANLNNRVTNTITNINYLDKNINKVGAMSAALSGLHPLSFDPDNKFNVAVSGGSYKDEQAVALGAFYYPNENTMFSLASTIGNNDNMVNIGASFKVGQTTTERKLKEQYKTAPISTVYVLETEVQQLKEANRKQQEENKKQQEENKKQQLLIEKLIAKVGI